MRRALFTAWCLPSAVVGACAAVLFLALGVRLHRIAGECTAFAFFLRPRCIDPFAWGRGWAGLTLAPFVFVAEDDWWLQTLRHELVHVGQAQTWGPLWGPAYVVMLARGWWRYRSWAAAYDAHPWEVAARHRAETPARRRAPPRPATNDPADA